jgi:hypothetical protein
MKLNEHDEQRSLKTKDLLRFKVEITHCKVDQPTENMQLNEYDEQRSLKTKDLLGFKVQITHCQVKDQPN